MTPTELKREYGSALSFVGGVDTQQILPKTSADEVYSIPMRLIEEMTDDGGGYVLAASHTVPPETPLDNIFSMYKAVEIRWEEILDRAADAIAHQ